MYGRLTLKLGWVSAKCLRSRIYSRSTWRHACATTRKDSTTNVTARDSIDACSGDMSYSKEQVLHYTKYILMSMLLTRC